MSDIEKTIKEYFTAKHFSVIRNGLPDFFICWGPATAYHRDKSWPEVFWVEVENKKEKLSQSQHGAMYFLKNYFPVFVLQSIDGNKYRIRRWIKRKNGDWVLTTIGELNVEGLNNGET